MVIYKLLLTDLGDGYFPLKRNYTPFLDIDACSSISTVKSKTMIESSTRARN